MRNFFFYVTPFNFFNANVEMNRRFLAPFLSEILKACKKETLNVLTVNTVIKSGNGIVFPC